MLAKLEYSSPPDEVCCWQGRRSGAADRRCGGAFAGLGAAAELLTSWGAVAKLLAGAPWRRGRQGTPQWQRCCWQGRHGRVGGAGEEWQWQGNATADWHGNATADWHGNATADWQGNARNAKEPAPADGTGPSQTFGCFQAEQSLVEDFACLFLLGMRIYI